MSLLHSDKFKKDIKIDLYVMWFKSLLHDQVFFDKFHVSNFFDRVNEELLTILSKNPNLSVQILI